MASKRDIKHNKKRNTGLVYEFLVRRLSSCLLENDSKGYKDALSIIQRYFYKGSPLDRERALFEAIIGTRGVSDRTAAAVITEVKREASKLDYIRLDRTKGRLIHEINRKLGKNLFSESHIDEYKAYASVQLLINGCSPKRTIEESVQRVRLEEALHRYMTIDPGSPDDEYSNVDDLAYRIAVKKFNERYSETLSESQKNLLKGYITSFVDDKEAGRFSRYLKKERSKLLTYLRSSHSVKEIAQDNLMLERLENAEDRLASMDLDRPGQDEVEDILLYTRLAEEISSDG